MSKLRVFLVLLLVQTGLSQQSARPSIQGIVVSVSSGKPVGDATVELIVVEGVRVISRTSTTDSDGKFAFRNLSPGSGYQIVVTGAGIQPTANGQRSSQDPWIPITLTDGEQRTDVKITVQSLTGIRGKVLDKQGAPIIGANIVAMKPAYINGRKIVEGFAYTVTDTRGQYRFSALPIGPYYIRVLAQNTGIPEMLMTSPALLDQSETSSRTLKDEPEGYPVVYYPGTNLETAKAIQIRDGSIIENVDIRMAKVRTARLRGSVVNPAKGGSVTSARVFLVPQSSAMDSNWTRTTESRNGQLDFRGVLPGAYTMTAMVMDGQTRLWGRKPIEIKEGENKTMDIAVSPGLTVEGRVSVRGLPGQSIDLAMISVRLIPDVAPPVDASLAGVQVNLPSATAVSVTDGSFTFRDVVPWNYRIAMAWDGRRAGVYVKSIRLGGRDILLDGLHVEGPIAEPLEIVLDTDSGGLDGRVTENSESASFAKVVLVPETRRRFDLYAAMTTTNTGRFQFQNIPPGDYKLFAWQFIQDGAWLDPDYLESYEDKGVRVHIDENSAEFIEIAIIK